MASNKRRGNDGLKSDLLPAVFILFLGLNAAKRFIERYSGHLEQMDLSILLKFDPLQEMIIEKLGTSSDEFFSSIGLTVTDYLKQAPPDDMRLFIWALEEYRDEYVSCHSILDEYFDIMGTYFFTSPNLTLVSRLGHFFFVVLNVLFFVFQMDTVQS